MCTNKKVSRAVSASNQVDEIGKILPLDTVCFGNQVKISQIVHIAIY